ncbi:MAG: toxin-antitoxin system YwqK family antitoxin [Bacteroidales bacterium]|nr:toxin-antitoxin system YwqK family antitoxin [Bacteroidales bacterium]
MKTLLFLLLCLFSYQLISQDTLIVYYDKDWKEITDKENSNFYRKAFPDNDKLWSVRDYYASKKIQMTGAYTSKKMETRHGPFTYYYENGQISSEGQYIKDKREGMWKEYYENGQLQYTGTFTNDNIEGVAVYWHENGQKKAEGKYLNGIKDGKWRYYYAGGNLQSEEDYKNGSVKICKCVAYHENGEIDCKGDLLNGLKQGTWAFYNADGRLFLKGTFNKGSMEGQWTRYFPEGSMQLDYKLGEYKGKPLGGMASRP